MLRRLLAGLRRLLARLKGGLLRRFLTRFLRWPPAGLPGRVLARLLGGLLAGLGGLPDWLLRRFLAGFLRWLPAGLLRRFLAGILDGFLAWLPIAATAPILLSFGWFLSVIVLLFVFLV